MQKSDPSRRARYPISRLQAAAMFRKKVDLASEPTLSRVEGLRKLKQKLLLMRNYEYVFKCQVHEFETESVKSPYWKETRRKVVARFHCKKCNKDFVSILGCCEIMFKVSGPQFNQNKSYVRSWHDPEYDLVRFNMKLYRMKCQSCTAQCQGQVFESQMEAMSQVFCIIIAEKYEQIPLWVHTDNREKMFEVHHHREDLCEACQNGVCFNIPKKKQMRQYRHVENERLDEMQDQNQESDERQEEKNQQDYERQVQRSFVRRRRGEKSEQEQYRRDVKITRDINNESRGRRVNRREQRYEEMEEPSNTNINIRNVRDSRIGEYQESRRRYNLKQSDEQETVHQQTCEVNTKIRTQQVTKTTYQQQKESHSIYLPEKRNVPDWRNMVSNSQQSNENERLRTVRIQQEQEKTKKLIEEELRKKQQEIEKKRQIQSIKLRNEEKARIQRLNEEQIETYIKRGLVLLGAVYALYKFWK